MEYKGLISGEITGKISIYNCDCMELLKQTPDNYYSLALVDPPYGIGISKNPVRQQHEKKEWDNSIPTKKYFNELFRVSKHQIIWGANYFPQFLEKSKGWIVWYKGQMGLTMSDCELAYSNIKSPTRVINIHRTHVWKEKPIHPTQKPTKLYQWLLTNYAEEGDKILDTHLGSGSIAIAVDSVNKIEKMNLTLTACELDKDYYDAAMKRINEQTNWQSLF